MVLKRQDLPFLAVPWGTVALFWVSSGCVPDVPFPGQGPDGGVGQPMASENISGAARAEATEAVGDHPDEAARPAGASGEHANMSGSSSDANVPEARDDGGGAASGAMMTTCDANLQKDPRNCGVCGRACPENYPRCEEGDCRPAPAPACGGVDLDSDRNNCGLCAWACKNTETCENGKCVVSCDADLANDPKNCGACGLSCETGHECRDGECGVIEVAGVTCPANQQVCGMACIPTSACCDDLGCRIDDVSNPYCSNGACIECKLASDCDSDELCEAGECTPKPIPCDGKCEPAEQCIDDRCVCPGIPDLSSDRSNCGSCGHRCGQREECVNGSCQAYCNGALYLSDENNCGETCEQCDRDELCDFGTCTSCGDIQMDENNCGECGKRCDPAQQCVEGRCVEREPCDGKCLSGERCDDGECRPVHCGNSQVDNGEACDPTARGWTVQMCDRSCKRLVWTRCEDAGDCAPNQGCYGGGCEPLTTRTGCPLFGLEADRWVEEQGRCALSCEFRPDGSDCPSGMHCVGGGTCTLDPALVSAQ